MHMIHMPEVTSSKPTPTPKVRAASWKLRIVELSSGYLIWNVLNYAFDYFIYPYVIYKRGPLIGGLCMTLLSMSACLLLMWIYDWIGRDWLGIETVKELKSYSGTSFWRQRLTRLLNMGDKIAFIILSLKFDPFITTAYMRHGAFNGMNRRDWVIFLSSGLLANLWWIAVCFGGVSALSWLLSRI